MPRDERGPADPGPRPETICPQIAPVGVRRLDQRELRLAPPRLDDLLPRDRGGDVVVAFSMDDLDLGEVRDMLRPFGNGGADRRGG